MRRYHLSVLSFICLSTFLGMSSALAGSADANLSKRMLQKKSATFNLAEFGADNPAAGKAARQKTLAKLTAASFPKFTEVPDKAKADFLIEGTVEELEWHSEDPLDTFTGWSGALLDTMVKESYLKMAVRYRIIDAGTGKILWEKKIANSITQKDMTLETGLEEISRRISGNFFQSAFEKDASKR